MHNLRHTSFYMKTNVLYNFDIYIKRGLHCHIYPTFSLHFIYWKSLDECFTDKNLLHISLTKFNKLNKRRKRTFLITRFKKTGHKSLISDGYLQKPEWWIGERNEGNTGNGVGMQVIGVVMRGIGVGMQGNRGGNAGNLDEDSGKRGGNAWNITAIVTLIQTSGIIRMECGRADHLYWSCFNDSKVNFLLMKSCNLHRVAVSQRTSKALSTEPEHQSEYLQNVPTSKKNKK